MIYHAKPYGVKVRFAPTLKQARAICTKLKVLLPTDCVGFTTWAPDGSIIVAVLDGNRATLVHECTHAALFVLQHVGIDPFAANGEPMAYLLDSMYAACDKYLSDANTTSTAGQ